MLSKKEKEYLQDIKTFEDTYGLEYARTVRSRIRKKVNIAQKDLRLVMDKDIRYEPTKEYEERQDIKRKNRRNKEAMNMIQLYAHNDLWEGAIANMNNYNCTSIIGKLIKERGPKLFDDFYYFFKNHWKLDYCPHCGKPIKDTYK